MVHDLTAENLSRLPKENIELEANSASSRDKDSHERQIERAEEDGHLEDKDVPALTISLPKFSVIIGPDHTQADTQAEMLAGLHTDRSADPPVGTPADLSAVLGTISGPCPPLPPHITPENEADNAYGIGATYAALFQLQTPVRSEIGSVLDDTMRREAAMDYAVFRPNLERIKRTRLSDTGATVLKTIRKRKRESKDTD